MACLDRIGPTAHHDDGNRLGRILGRPDPRVPSCYHDDINLETHQLGQKLREPIALPLRISVLGGDILSFYVAKLAQSQPNCLGTGGLTQLVRPAIHTLSAGPSSAAAPRQKPRTPQERQQETPPILDSYSVQSENLFLTYSCRQKVDDFLNGVISFAIRGFQFAVYRECWVWLSVKEAVGQRATDTLVEKDKHHSDF